MGEEAYKSAGFEELMDVIKEGNMLERLMYRKKASASGNKPFVSIKLDDLVGQAEEQAEGKVTTPSETVAFKSLHYTVAEGTEFVVLTIIKKKEEPMTFRCINYEDTAIFGQHFAKMDETIVMRAYETEREIKIAIVDDDKWEPDRDFIVKLTDKDDP